MHTHKVLFALFALILGLALGALFGASALRRAKPLQEEAAKPDLTAILERLDHIESALRALGVREPVAALPASDAREPLSPVPSPPAGDTRSAVAVPESAPQMEEELTALKTAIDALRQAVTERTLPAKFPSAEAIRKASPDMNVAELGQLVAQYSLGVEGRDAVEAKVRWMTQDEVLAAYGRPSRVDANGSWLYKLGPGGPYRWRTVTFIFVEDYVTQVVTERRE